jgi:hypothetical protein
MTQLEESEEEPYMTQTKHGKKRKKGMGVKRPVTPEGSIPNILQTTSRQKLEVYWAKPAEEVTNESAETNLEEFIGEYHPNTNGLRDVNITQEQYDMNYEKWCDKQAEYMTERQSHTDAGLSSI